jgi:hypothetical protein
MADYAISNVPRRVVYAPSGVGPYAFTFEILDQTDIAVYRGSTLLTLTTDYTVIINANGTGSVTLVLTAGTSNITIVGSKNIQRTTDFTTGGDLFANTLNDELDNQTIFIQQVAETAERGLKAPVTDPTDIAMTLPNRDGRKGKVLAFDSVTGNPVSGPALDAVVTVIEQSANINTVADNIADVIAVADNETNINTVAGVSGNVTTVAGSISNVNTVADDLNEAESEINTVAVNIANVNTVGNNIASVNTVSGNNANVTTVAGISGNVTTVAGISAAVSNVSSISAAVSGVNTNEANVNTVAGQISPTNNVATVAGISANVTTVAGISANVTSVAGNSTNINTVATNIANVNSVATNIANVNSVAGNATNINAVAGNSTNINTVAGISSNVTTVATNSGNVTTVAGSIASVNTNATNIANINQNAANIVAIQNASANATAAASSATAAAGSATSASASAAAASAVALGNEPVRHSVRPSLLLDFANTKTLDPRITFTRASTGTFYDGKTVAKAEENLFVRSQEFDNASWIKGASTTVSANNAVAPDGTTTADTVVFAGQFAGVRQAVSLLPNTTYTVSLFARRSSGTNDISIFTLGPAVLLGTYSPTSTWARYSVTFTTTSDPYDEIILAQDRNAADWTNLEVWGAQLEQRSAVTAYTVTTTAPITNYIPALQTAASGVARFEHNPITGESLGLEIEEQRTNLLTYSDDFADASWTKTGSSISSNTIVSPDGALTGDKLIESTANSGHNVSRLVTVSNATAYTSTIYAKAGERRYIGMFANNPGVGKYFDLVAGTVLGNFLGTPTSASITSVGNGWYRCSITATTTSTNATGVNVYLSTDGISTFSYAGDGYSGIYIWGAQLEAGAFATSYIPTVASQVTRSADVASMTGTNFSSWYRADEGTLYAEAVPYSVLSGSTIGTIVALNTSANSTSEFNNSHNLRLASTTQFQTVVGGANQAIFGTFTLPVNTSAKFAYAYKTNDFAGTANGAAVTTDTSGTVPTTVDQLMIGKLSTGTPSLLTGTIKKFSFYPRRLTNAELVSLSTI